MSTDHQILPGPPAQAAHEGLSSARGGRLRLVLCVDALHPRARRSDHPRALAAALEAAGHTARVIPVAAGLRWPGRGPVDGQGPLDFHPDGWIAYDPMSPAAWWASRQARRSGRPLVIVEPGWTGPKRLHERLLDGLGQRLWGRGVRLAAGRVAVFDPWTASRAQARGFLSERIVQVPWGVDPERFRPGLSSELVARHRLRGRLLLHVGALEPGRGLELLIEAFARGVGRRPDWSLVLLGEGSQTRRLRAAADRLGVGASVHLLGWAPPEDLAGLMAAATLFAAPDPGDAASGQQLARAMSTGLAVVASDRPRLACRVEPGRSGLIAPAGDVGAWTAALSQLAGDPALRAELGRAARARTLERCAWPKVAETFAGFFA